MARTLAPRKCYATQLALERITGESADGYQSAAMAWGTEMEDAARLMLRLTLGYKIETCGLLQHDTLPLRGSPDGLTPDVPATWENKSPTSHVHVDTIRTRKVPHNYYWQQQGQLLLVGYDLSIYTSFDPRMPPNARLVVIEVERNQSDIDRLGEELIKFDEEINAIVETIQNYQGAPHGQQRHKTSIIPEPAMAKG